MSQQRIVVAIDGPAGAGKSTVARSVAAKLGFIYIDTGAMYRAVALWALRANIDEADTHKMEQLAREAEITFEPGSNSVFLNGEDVTAQIRTADVSAAASKVSAIAGVRRVLVEKQREMAASGSVVMEGRDIGSVVFPDARVKIFLDAPPSERVDRRSRELAQRGVALDPEVAARAIEERDQRDRTRAEAPLVQAPDAVYVDSGGLSVEQVEEHVLRIVRERTANGKEYSR
ncbi:MAG TPA: (d)CMP kinase [Bryobacteraceae bacterium]|nr:(d)CMP kinase [Bryobacteraceae bacterium]